jgi:hypothetical protein
MVNIGNKRVSVCVGGGDGRWVWSSRASTLALPMATTTPQLALLTASTSDAIYPLRPPPITLHHTPITLPYAPPHGAPGRTLAGGRLQDGLLQAR